MILLNEKTVVALFVRRPVAGRVKTRLARDLGDGPACELYQAMVADVIAAVITSGMPLVLFHDGTAEDALPPAWTAGAAAVCVQEGGDLGERMAGAFRASFRAGAHGVILAGSDIPGIDRSLLSAAAAAIAGHDAVFSPAVDGGYCLVAAAAERYDGRIFHDIPWSSPGVMERTVAACTAAGLSCRLLEPRRDIDTMDDLVAYCARPAACAPATNAWLADHGFLSRA